MQVRTGRAGEGEALTALVIRSKATWGYDEALMRAFAASLVITEASIARGDVFVAVDDEDRPLGVAEIVTDKGAGQPGALKYLFIAPEAQGRGVGRLLIDAVSACARGRGVAALTIDSDPFAARFYERLGARLIGETQSEAVAGRMLPLYRLDLV